VLTLGVHVDGELAQLGVLVEDSRLPLAVSALVLRGGERVEIVAALPHVRHRLMHPWHY
jgi:hypothetical protein